MKGKNMPLIEEEDSKFWEEIANYELKFLDTSKTTISSTRTERCKPLIGVLKDRDYFWTKVGRHYKLCLGNGEVLYCVWVFDNFYEVVKISEKSEDGKFANFTEEKLTFGLMFLTKALEITEEYAADSGIKPEKDADWYADDYTD